MLLSRGLALGLVHYTERCILGPPRTTLAWYWDEVEFLGRCVYEVAEINCSLPTNARQEPVVLFSVREESEWHILRSFVEEELQGRWSELNFATLHPVEAERMAWLGRRFAADRASAGGGVKEASAEEMS